MFFVRYLYTAETIANGYENASIFLGISIYETFHISADCLKKRKTLWCISKDFFVSDTDDDVIADKFSIFVSDPEKLTWVPACNTGKASE